MFRLTHTDFEVQRPLQESMLTQNHSDLIFQSFEQPLILLSVLRNKQWNLLRIQIDDFERWKMSDKTMVVSDRLPFSISTTLK